MVVSVALVGACLSLADCGITLATRINTLLKKVENADVSLRALVNEIQQLSEVLKNLGSKLPDSGIESKPLTDLSLSGLEREGWAGVRQIMNHCQESLDGLKEIVDKISKNDGIFMRKAMIAKGFEQHRVTLEVRKEEISRYRQALDIDLTSSVVSLLLRQNLFNRTLNTKLDELAAGVGILRQMIVSQNLAFGSGYVTTSLNADIVDNLNRFAESTRQFTSRVTVIASEQGSSQLRRNDIASWVMDNPLPEEISQVASQQSPEPIPNHAPGSGDLVRNAEVFRNGFKRALQAYEAGQFENAQQRLERLLTKLGLPDYAEALGFDYKEMIQERLVDVHCRRREWVKAEEITVRNLQGKESVVTRIVLSYCQNRLWADAKRILLDDQGTEAMDPWWKMYMLSQVTFALHEYEAASKLCDDLMRKVGHGHVLKHMCMYLLSELYEAIGDEDEAEWHRDSLPPGIEDCVKLEKLSWNWPDEIAAKVQEIWGPQLGEIIDQSCWDELKADIKHSGLLGSGGACSLLHVFVQAGNALAVQLLLYKGKGSDMIRAKEKSTGRTALHIATETAKHGIFKLLLGADADPLEADNNGISSYALAISGGDEYIVRTLIEGSSNVNEPVRAGSDGKLVRPLMLALEAENKKILELLLENGARVNVRDSEGNTPLTKAIQDGRSLDIVQTLLRRGANPSARNDRKETALIVAVKANSEEFVNLLLNLEKKPEVDEKNTDGETPLYLAAKMGSHAIVKALLESGADCVTPYESGITPLDVASAKNVGVLELLQGARRQRMSWLQRHFVRDHLDRKVSKAKSKEARPLISVPAWTYEDSRGTFKSTS